MDQQHCAHERVITYGFIEEGFVRRVCEDCGMQISPAAGALPHDPAVAHLAAHHEGVAVSACD